MVDPIDGTNAFLAGRPEFSVAAALIERGAPIAAAVYNPATDEFFDAMAGGGAQLNGAAVRASEQTALDGARLAVSRIEHRDLDWHRGLGRVTVEALSSVAYKIALVAAGRFDATATLWGKSGWDIAAGDLLVREAGGRISDAAGRAFDYTDAGARISSVVAAGAGLHGPLLDRIAEVA